ncbi:LysR family transcriptional regulator [Pseudomonas arsenicoxydans]|uniref:LysR family transcriptional regulator n=1 Tax=Pseudomonas arsenicoxydans TaxID=702115 RepID=A0A4P6G8I1_9PSED|nr:LysR family transcriptional regulator [Pseudomonas arsenicoxydans]QAY86666.1 LysR family transcriptional regulator [Pseudomonas arsenicoxydans]
MSHLRGIETFVKTVECGSIAAAARQLGITAAAASQNVARLEKELGTRLLTRTTRSQALTAAGEVYFARVGPILGELAQARSEISDLHHEVQGRLKIASWVAIGRHVIAPLLPVFMARYPKVQVEMMITDSNVDHLRDGVDVGIRSRHGLEAGLVARRIATAPMILCAAPSYLDSHGRPTEPEALNNHACLAFRMPIDGRLMEWPFLRAGERLAPKRNIVAVCNDNDTLAAMTVGGVGIARLGSFVANPLIAQGLVEPLFLQHSGRGRTRTQADPEPMEFFVVYRDRHHVPAPVRAFVDFIADALESHELLKAPTWPRKT